MCLRIGRKLNKSLIKILNMKKECSEKFRRFRTPFLAVVNTAAADNFSNFFANILIVNYSNYFRRGSRDKFCF
jgi:hypothetical protein